MDATALDKLLTQKNYSALLAPTRENMSPVASCSI